jgi:cyclopropane fatty-acyl-phospholipid synthase-like methyltransferase
VTEDPIAALRRPERYPRSSAYDPEWLLDLDMGPNPLWMLEDLCTHLDLQPGMRVLDLGPGRGATSVFLAREFSVEVVAADLWVSAEDAAAVHAAAGVADRVTPVHAEAHALPFDHDSFDAIVSVDAWEYFGTADSYLPYLLRFLRPGGAIGVATPAMTREVRDMGAIPAHIRDVFGWEAMAWHTPEWYRFQWETTEMVTMTAARLQDGAWDDWRRWAEALAARAGTGADRTTLDVLEADGGEYLSFVLLAATKR